VRKGRWKAFEEESSASSNALSATISPVSQTLEEALRVGGLVVAVPIADASAAGDMARLLRAASAYSFAHFSNWEFQPVKVEPRVQTEL
jgi:hypothetical protein